MNLVIQDVGSFWKESGKCIYKPSGQWAAKKVAISYRWPRGGERFEQRVQVPGETVPPIKWGLSGFSYWWKAYFRGLRLDPALAGQQGMNGGCHILKPNGDMF